MQVPPSVHSFSTIPESDLGKDFEVRSIGERHTTFAKPGVPKAREYQAENGTECESGLKQGSIVKLMKKGMKFFFGSKTQEQKWIRLKRKKEVVEDNWYYLELLQHKSFIFKPSHFSIQEI